MQITIKHVSDLNKPEGKVVAKVKIPMRKLETDRNAVLDMMMVVAKKLNLFSPVVKRDQTIFGGYVRETGTGDCLVAE